MTSSTWDTGAAASGRSAAAATTTATRSPRKRREKLLWLRLTVAVIVTVVMAFPLYWMLLTAFSTRADLYAPGLHLWPQHFTLQNFVRPFAEFPVWRWFANSLLVSVVVTVITVVCNLLAGYAFAKLKFRGRNALFLVLLSTLMIPPQAIIVPQFFISIGLHLYGGLWAVILPEAAAIFGVFLARQFFLAVPDELIEAAQLDGAGRFRTFVSVVLPLCRPLLAVLVLLTFMGEWNAFGWPLVALSGNQDLFTVPIGIVGTLQGQYTSDYGAIMAVNLLMILPIVALFLAFQRYFVEGLSRSGLR